MEQRERVPANAAIYLPYDEVDLVDVFPDASAVWDESKGVRSFRVRVGGNVVNFNEMPKAEVANHLEGFLRYIQSLDEQDDRKRDASTALRATRTILGLETALGFEDNHAIWASLFRIADKYDGYVFTQESLLLPNGAVIFGPLRATSSWVGE